MISIGTILNFSEDTSETYNDHSGLTVYVGSGTVFYSYVFLKCRPWRWFRYLIIEVMNVYNISQNITNTCLCILLNAILVYMHLF